MMKPVGRILCISEDGGPQFTVLYNVPTVVREAEVFTDNGIYYQNYQDADGQWVYKYIRPLAGRPSDPLLSDYRYATDTSWDGPQPSKPIVVWTDIDRKFEDVLSKGGPVPAKDVQELFGLTHAAFNKLPAPEVVVTVQAIVDVTVVPSPPDDPLEVQSDTPPDNTLISFSGVKGL